MTRFSRAAVFLSAALAGAVIGCRPQGAQPKQGAAFQMPPQVAVIPAQQQEIVEWEEFTGRTAPVNYVEVRPRVSGHIEAVNRFIDGLRAKGYGFATAAALVA